VSLQPLVDIDSLKIDVRITKKLRLKIVDSASFILERGEILGLIGESGSGKTMLCRALVGTLARRGAYISGGKLTFDGTDLLAASRSDWTKIRGTRIGYVPQSALAGPNPVLTIGAQLAEAILQGMNHDKEYVRKRSLELLEIVHISRPEVVLHQYPYELSGGMRQRVMIACAIAQNPALVVADEPTTGLDVTVQAEIMQLLERIRQDFHTSIILVSHDLSLINEVCDNIVVMHAGATVEELSAKEITHSRHPYTKALYDSRIDLVAPKGKLVTIKGAPPTVGNWPTGCRFAARCDYVMADCRSALEVPLVAISSNHKTACLHYDQMRN
jgi:oligopeptide/dipeptide ABC transporter ATP-binding protein